jgi:hypothetical protein
MVNIEDAIKVAGMEGKMMAMDLTEVVERHMVSPQVHRTPALAEETAVPV